MINFEKINKYSCKKVEQYFKKEELKKLHTSKLYCDDLYYNTGDTAVNDKIYDILKDTLMKRDPKYIPPVGVKIRYSDNESKLPYWLGSADKITPKEPEALRRWLNKNKTEEYLISEKLDGVSGLLVVKNGVKNLYTRGDGISGSDISYLIQYFNIPKKLPDMSVRGELIIHNKTFLQKYKYEGLIEDYKKNKTVGRGFGKTYKNSRNMVSGLIGAKTVRPGLEDIKFVVYEIVDFKDRLKSSEQFKKLKKLGFTTAIYDIVTKIDIEILTEQHNIFKDKTEFEIDGIVIQSNILYDRNICKNPKYMFAFKVQSEDNKAQTTVLDIEWKVSRFGQIIPVVIFESVELSGATLCKASAHNAHNLVSKCIGIGAEIYVTRSKDVIPFIQEVITPALEIKYPDVEKDLNGLDYKWDENKVHLIINGSMDIMYIKLFDSFFSKMNIKHVSRATLKKIYNEGFETLLSIISIKKEDLLKIEGIKDKSADRIIKNIHLGLQDVTVTQILGSSSVFGFGFGRKRTDMLFNDIPNILKIYKNFNRLELIEKITKIEGFSEITAIKVVDNLKNAKLFIEQIKPYCTYKEKVRVSDSLVGKKFVTSGFRDKELEQKIIERGGKIVSSVSKKTSGVIVLDMEQTSGKIKKAKESGVRIYLKEEFIIEML